MTSRFQNAPPPSSSRYGSSSSYQHDSRDSRDSRRRSPGLFPSLSKARATLISLPKVLERVSNGHDDFCDVPMYHSRVSWGLKRKQGRGPRESCCFFKPPSSRARRQRALQYKHTRLVVGQVSRYVALHCSSMKFCLTLNFCFQLQMIASTAAMEVKSEAADETINGGPRIDTRPLPSTPKGPRKKKVLVCPHFFSSKRFLL